MGTFYAVTPLFSKLHKTAQRLGDMDELFFHLAQQRMEKNIHCEINLRRKSVPTYNLKTNSFFKVMT